MEVRKVLKTIIDTTTEYMNGNGIIVDLIEGGEYGVIRNKVLRISRFQDYHFKEEIFIRMEDLELNGGVS
jgi:hypothetical protein